MIACHGHNILIILSTVAADDTQNRPTEPPVSKENMPQGVPEDLDLKQMQHNQQPEGRELVWSPCPGKGVLVNDGECVTGSYMPKRFYKRQSTNLF